MLYLVATIGVVGLGLASRHVHGLVPQVLGKYPGDALWTLMVFFGLGAMLPQASTARVTDYAIAISFVVEFTQLCQAPWINAIRGTTVGHLVLGSGFGWGDLVAYAVGAGIGLCGELVLNRLGKTRRATGSTTWCCFRRGRTMPPR